MTIDPEARLRELGLELPPVAGAVANYAPWVISSGIIYTSGQLPWIAGKLHYTGRIGGNLSIEDGYKACRLSCLNALSQLKDAAGSLARIRRVIRLEGVLNVATGFTQHPQALNGASDLINSVFGERGRHTRMIYTNPEMPMDCTSLVVLWAEIEA